MAASSRAGNALKNDFHFRGMADMARLAIGLLARPGRELLFRRWNQSPTALLVS
jgi:hypothetical protein